MGFSVNRNLVYAAKTTSSERTRVKNVLEITKERGVGKHSGRCPMRKEKGESKTTSSKIIKDKSQSSAGSFKSYQRYEEGFSETSLNG